MGNIEQIFAANLRQLREKRGLSQETLAERANLAPTHISHLETGRRWAKPETLKALAEALQVGEEALFASAAAPIVYVEREPVSAEIKNIAQQAAQNSLAALGLSPALIDAIGLLAPLDDSQRAQAVAAMRLEIEGIRRADQAIAESAKPGKAGNL